MCLWLSGALRDAAWWIWFCPSMVTWVINYHVCWNVMLFDLKVTKMDPIDVTIEPKARPQPQRLKKTHSVCRPTSSKKVTVFSLSEELWAAPFHMDCDSQLCDMWWTLYISCLRTVWSGYAESMEQGDSTLFVGSQPEMAIRLNSGRSCIDRRGATNSNNFFNCMNMLQHTSSRSGPFNGY